MANSSNIQGSPGGEQFPVIEQTAAVIQPGTRGKWKDQSFEVIGRFRAWVEEFVCNYWAIVFEDRRTAYLVEAYGVYAIYEALPDDDELARKNLEKMKVGSQRTLFKQESFVLERKYNCHRCEVEGEPVIPYHQSKFKTYEFAHANGRHIELIDFGPNQVVGYEVYYTDFTSLGLTNTRTYEPFKKNLTCVSCSNTYELKAFPYAQSVACPNCGASYALEDGLNFKQRVARSSPPDGVDITIGTTATIKNIEYQVIGFALKSENNAGAAEWKEYTLFNPAEGFAFLSEYNGNWIITRETGDAPVISSDYIQHFDFKDETFQLFNTYTAKVLSATGEFPYNSFNDQNKKIREFISPPEIWIQERDSREGILWFKGEHVNRKDLKRAFGDNISMPYKVGVGAAEPKSYASPFKILFITFCAMLLLLIAHHISVSDKQHRVVFERNYTMADTISTVTLASNNIKLDRGRSNVKFEIFAPVDNSWFELAATLVNTQTGAEYSMEKGVEYYHGYDDGYWSEGDKEATAYLSEIPAGTYVLQLEAVREKQLVFVPGLTEGFTFNVKATYDVPNDRNLAIGALALLLWGGIHYLWVRYNESRRWANSAYSPYNND